MKNTNIDQRAFTLVEILIGILLAVIVISVIYFVFIGGARQATSGTGKLKSFHRLRIVTEILKDDLREANKILEPTAGEHYSDTLKFTKYVSFQGDKEATNPPVREVTYTFNEKETRLTSEYGAKGELVNTTLFTYVGFRQVKIDGRSFVRVKFQVPRDKDGNSEVTIYHTIAPRHIQTAFSQKFWHGFTETRAEVE